MSKILEADFELIEGNYIYSYSNSSLSIKYLTTETELYSREIKFNIALSYLIAYYICADLQNNDSKIQLFLKLKNTKISEARINNLKIIGVEIIVLVRQDVMNFRTHYRILQRYENNK